MLLSALQSQIGEGSPGITPKDEGLETAGGEGCHEGLCSWPKEMLFVSITAIFFNCYMFKVCYKFLFLEIYEHGKIITMILMKLFLKVLYKELCVKHIRQKRRGMNIFQVFKK